MLRPLPRLGNPLRWLLPSYGSSAAASPPCKPPLDVRAAGVRRVEVWPATREQQLTGNRMTPAKTIGILYPGEMGASLAALLRGRGHRVVTTLAGRGERTAGRCREAE